MLIAHPSFSLLYILDEVISPTMTIKAVGLITIFGLELYIFYKIKDTFKSIKGQKNIIIFLIIALFAAFILYSLLLEYGPDYLKAQQRLFLMNQSSRSMSDLARASARLIYFLEHLNYITFSYVDTFHNISCYSIIAIYPYKSSPALAIINNRKHRNFHNRTRAINRIGPHNQDVLSVLVGLLLGDGYANNRSGEGVRFAIKQSKIHKDYLFFLYNFFLIRGYTSNLEPRLYKRTIKGIDKLYLGYEFNTYTFRSLVWLYELFYKNGKKVIPQNISKLLTPLSLAILLADDGCFVKSGVRISLNAFTLPEIKLFVLTLKEKFNLDCTIQEVYLKNPKSLPDDSTVRSDTQKNKYIKKEKYSIYIRSKSLLTLKNLVSPHMPKSMLYKIGL